MLCYLVVLSLIWNCLRNKSNYSRHARSLVKTFHFLWLSFSLPYQVYYDDYDHLYYDDCYNKNKVLHGQLNLFMVLCNTQMLWTNKKSSQMYICAYDVYDCIRIWTIINSGYDESSSNKYYASIYISLLYDILNT